MAKICITERTPEKNCQTCAHRKYDQDKQEYYFVTKELPAYAEIEVEANSEEEALDKAEEIFENEAIEFEINYDADGEVTVTKAEV